MIEEFQCVCCADPLEVGVDDIMKCNSCGGVVCADCQGEFDNYMCPDCRDSEGTDEDY